MADVIRAALDAHRLVLSTGRPDPTRGNCSTWATCGCGWTMNARAAQARTAHITHQAEVATAAVLEAVERVLDEHYCMCGLVTECRCGWSSTTGTHEGHLAEVIVAALAGEG